MQYIVRCPDGRRWAVEQAVSLKAACNAINSARASGSVGWRDMMTIATVGEPYEAWPSEVMADVHQLNSDGTKRQPYTMGY